jgi:hypothetical protein
MSEKSIAARIERQGAEQTDSTHREAPRPTRSRCARSGDLTAQRADERRDAGRRLARSS